MTGEAFAQAVQTYGDTVYRVAFHALNSREDAEDVMQTVMLKLFEYRATALRARSTGSTGCCGCRSMRAGSSCAPSGGAFPSLWMTGASWRHRNMGSGQSCWRL